MIYQMNSAKRNMVFTELAIRSSLLIQHAKKESGQLKALIVQVVLALLFLLKRAQLPENEVGSSTAEQHLYGNAYSVEK